MERKKRRCMIKRLGYLFLFTTIASFISACSSINPNLYSKNIEKFSLASSALASNNRHFLKPVRNRSVRAWINYFTKKDRARFQRFINNGTKYKPHIEKILSQYGLPLELYYVGFIESGYYLHAKSHASAVGPWQFIRGTGRQYGLKVNRNMDDRRNVIKATHAAAKYLKRLHKIFGSWELALSGYNMGEYGLMRRIRKARTRDYYRLARRRVIPRETRSYIPKVLAVMHIHKYARKYGFNLNGSHNHAYKSIAKVKVPGGTTLRSIAKYTDTSYKKLKALNPEFKRDRLPRGRTHQILVPKSRATSVKRYAYNTRNGLYKTKYYRVRRGDNLTHIASKFGLTIRAIKKLNRLSSNKILINQKIKIAQSARRSKKYHVVKAGDNLTQIASRYGVNLHRLKSLNSISRSVIHPGQKLIVGL